MISSTTMLHIVGTLSSCRDFMISATWAVFFSVQIFRLPITCDDDLTDDLDINFEVDDFGKGSARSLQNSCELARRTALPPRRNHLIFIVVVHNSCRGVNAVATPGFRYPKSKFWAQRSPQKEKNNLTPEHCVRGN